MDYLSVPPALAWGRTRASAHSPLFRQACTAPCTMISNLKRKGHSVTLHIDDVLKVLLLKLKINKLVWPCRSGFFITHLKTRCFITSKIFRMECSSRSNALPPLDWPLPSQFDQYELRIEVQPRPHHRAHYETEGSRGAVKAAPTGHPVVKVKPKIALPFICMLL